MRPEASDFSLRKFFPDDANLFVRNLKPSPGFTFQAEGLPHKEFQARLVMRKWESLDDGGRAVWSHAASGVEIEASYRMFRKTNTLELDGRIHNRGAQTIRNVNGPFPLSIAFDGAGLGQARYAHAARRGVNRRVLPSALLRRDGDRWVEEPRRRARRRTLDRDGDAIRDHR